MLSKGAGPRETSAPIRVHVGLCSPGRRAKGDVCTNEGFWVEDPRRTTPVVGELPRPSKEPPASWIEGAVTRRNTTFRTTGTSAPMVPPTLFTIVPPREAPCSQRHELDN